MSGDIPTSPRPSGAAKPPRTTGSAKPIRAAATPSPAAARFRPPIAPPSKGRHAAEEPAPSLDTSAREESPPARPKQGLLRRTISEFNTDNLTDWAAALTYYSVLSIFPGMLVLAAALGMLGAANTGPLIDDLTATAPSAVRQILTDSMAGLTQSPGSAGIVAIVGLLGALWAASGYVGAFMRASNVIYDVPEGRPIWKTLPLRVAITVAVGILLLCCAVIVAFTGGIAEAVGGALGFGEEAVALWGIVKWPVLLLLVALILTILYWASPNAKVGGISGLALGGLLAVFLWLLVSAGFAFYAANFASYNKTYGTLGAIIVFLVWLWLSNLAILFGAEFNAERQRGRAIAAGAPRDAEPFVALRDSRATDAGTGTDWAAKDRKAEPSDAIVTDKK